MRTLLCILALFFWINVYPQSDTTYLNNFDFSTQIGSMFSANSYYNFNETKIHGPSLLQLNVETGINFKHFSISLNFAMYGYDYLIDNNAVNSYVNSKNDFYLLDYDEHYLHNSIEGLYLGLSHKFYHKRWIIIPNFKIGYLFNSYVTCDNFTFKQINSNNITHVQIDQDVNYDKFGFKIGSGFRFHISRHWGLSSNLEYNYFNPEVTITTKYENSDGSNITNIAIGNLKNSGILCSVGMFWSFAKF
jgi:hypothetical protein